MSEASDKAAAARAARAEAPPVREDAPPSMPEVVEMPGSAGVEGERHDVNDLIRASYALFGVSSEVFAGAVAEAGWEMTKQAHLGEARVILEKFLELPV